MKEKNKHIYSSKPPQMEKKYYYIYTFIYTYLYTFYTFSKKHWYELFAGDSTPCLLSNILLV